MKLSMTPTDAFQHLFELAMQADLRSGVLEERIDALESTPDYSDELLERRIAALETQVATK